MEVDTELGLVRVVEVATAQDVGKAMNPQALEGQIEGGIAQGLGLALLEEIQIKEGKIQNASFTDYLIPTILDMPAVRMEILELADPEAPYGLKGVGEPPTIASTPAIVAALRDATGQGAHARPRETGADRGHSREAAGRAPAAGQRRVRRDRTPRREGGALVPAYERAELSAELKVRPSAEAERSPQRQVEAAKRAAGGSGLAREGGPETTVLAGGRKEVLEAAMKVVEAALEAGARAVEMKVEAEGDAPRFTGDG